MIWDICTSNDVADDGAVKCGTIVWLGLLSRRSWTGWEIAGIQQSNCSQKTSPRSTNGCVRFTDQTLWRKTDQFWGEWKANVTVDPPREGQKYCAYDCQNYLGGMLKHSPLKELWQKQSSWQTFFWGQPKLQWSNGVIFRSWIGAEKNQTAK